jgi:hypothetical protein
MPLALTVGAYTATNDQKVTTISGSMTITGTGNYPVGGFAVDSVIKALLEATGTIMAVYVQTDVGSGYIYNRQPATGKLMVLQVPPSGSLTTAAPLQQVPSTLDQNTFASERLNFVARVFRNA